MEYVHITPEEQKYAQKNLLQSQIEVLTIMKRYQAYKQLRKKELILKSALKRKVTELNEELKILDRALPSVHTAAQTKEKVNAQIPIKKRSDLESEIIDIKRKLERLQ
jgi:hypothetical protein